MIKQRLEIAVWLKSEERHDQVLQSEKVFHLNAKSESFGSRKMAAAARFEESMTAFEINLSKQVQD